jgi:hypothetical protein
MILQNISQLQQYNLKLAKYLFSLNYKPIPCDDSIPYYSYKNISYSIDKCLSYLAQSNNINTNVCLIVDNFIVLDVDTDAEFLMLKQLSSKLNIKSNLVVKTLNGYHIYYSVDYDVKSQNNSNNRIAIKCNSMPITAPHSYRATKNHIYKPKYQLVDSSNLVHLPLEMYKELKGNDEINKPTTVIEKVVRKETQNNTANYNRYNLPVTTYLNKLDVNHYLLGDRIVWLNVLSACKSTNDTDAFSACYEWSKQGKYSNMPIQEFKCQWRSAEGVRNGYAWLHANTKVRK